MCLWLDRDNRVIVLGHSRGPKSKCVLSLSVSASLSVQCLIHKINMCVILMHHEPLEFFILMYVHYLTRFNKI